MTFDDHSLALAHYRMMFSDVASLGTGNPPANWQTEYARVMSSGLSAVLIVASSFEGGNASSQRNFDQKVLMRALLVRRGELDPAFDSNIFAPATTSRPRGGFSIRLSP